MRQSAALLLHPRLPAVRDVPGGKHAALLTSISMFIRTFVGVQLSILSENVYTCTYAIITSLRRSTCIKLVINLRTECRFVFYKYLQKSV